MDKYGLIGYPLGHSFSISYFNEKFESEGIDAVYENFEIPQIDDVKEIIDSNPDLKGFNVTIPYKQQVLKYIKELSPEAKAIGAVNVIRIEHKGNKTVLKGFNSDVIGFTKSIEPILNTYHKKALILGTGGAAKAVQYGLQSLGIETLFVSRTKKKNAITYEEVTADIVREYNVIVNCTSTNVRSCPMRRWTATPCSTICFTIPTRRNSSDWVPSAGQP